MKDAHTSAIPVTDQEFPFAESSVLVSYVWDNIITEKHDSDSWLYSLYEGSIFGDVWTVLTSNVL